MAREASQPKPPQRFWRLLKHGDTWDEYGSDPVRLVGEIVRLAVENGVALSWLERLLTNPANAAAAHVATARNPHARIKLDAVRSWYEKTGNTPRRHWDDDTGLERWRAELLEIRHLATSSRWPASIEYRESEDADPVRVRGADLRRCLAAHLQLALAAAGVDYPASRRKVAATAHLGDAVSARCSAVLVKLGILKWRRPPGRIGPFSCSYYRVDVSGDALREILEADTAHDELADLSALECHPVWRYGNSTRFDVWAQIVADDGRATVASIAAATTCPRYTVRRVITRMVELELVERLDDGTVRALSADPAALDAAAIASGMMDRSRRQLERHEADREHRVELVLRRPNLLAEALRRGVRAVVQALRDGFIVRRTTGEVITVSAEREQPPEDVAAGSDRQHAPPLEVAA